MTAPVSYTTKDPHTVQAMLYNVWDVTGNDVKVWISSLLAASFEEETILIVDDGYGSFQVLIGEEFLFAVSSGQYVYLDEDGFHAADKEAFEMVYKQTPA